MAEDVSTNVADDTAPKKPASTNDKLDVIIDYLHRMERRDRIRLTGGTLRSLIALIPIIIVVGSTWYFYLHSNEILTQIIEQSSKMVQQGFSDQVRQYMPK